MLEQCSLVIPVVKIRLSNVFLPAIPMSVPPVFERCNCLTNIGCWAVCADCSIDAKVSAVQIIVDVVVVVYGSSSLTPVWGFARERCPCVQDGFGRKFCKDAQADVCSAKELHPNVGSCGAVAEPVFKVMNLPPTFFALRVVIVIHQFVV